jgi:hypothetical protein
VKDQQLTAQGGSGNAATLVNAKKSVGQGAEQLNVALQQA